MAAVMVADIKLRCSANATLVFFGFLNAGCSGTARSVSFVMHSLVLQAMCDICCRPDERVEGLLRGCADMRRGVAAVFFGVIGSAAFSYHGSCPESAPAICVYAAAASAGAAAVSHALSLARDAAPQAISTAA
eukprot:TRINITY_DN15929_c0_g1_i1.p3 TRINITY_DN15929_c0_g1~~TRINITY_DN15929_c0_g1_i1.p3  ORF type:complete len:133 (+),score=32.36 TRINITY_DN15929_c0_g1_i1:541-939(+)